MDKFLEVAENIFQWSFINKISLNSRFLLNSSVSLTNHSLSIRFFSSAYSSNQPLSVPLNRGATSSEIRNFCRYSSAWVGNSSNYHHSSSFFPPIISWFLKFCVLQFKCFPIYARKTKCMNSVKMQKKIKNISANFRCILSCALTRICVLARWRASCSCQLCQETPYLVGVLPTSLRNTSTSLSPDFSSCFLEVWYFPFHSIFILYPFSSFSIFLGCRGSIL